MNPASFLFKKLERNLWYRAHWRCAEPVVVIESDDWGMKRKSCVEEVSRYGTAGEWANEEFETTKDLQDFYGVLSEFRGRNARPPCVTANFIVANADFEEIEKSGFTHYYDRFLDETESKEIFDTYREGIRRRVFYPQYHGRKHFSSAGFIADLKENTSGARELLRAGYHGGASLFKGENWRYHSEYFDWKAGKAIPAEQILKDLRESFDFFERQFRITPRSTIPPHYIFTDETERAWREVGIRYVQGSGYRLQRSGDQKIVRSHYMGQKSGQGLIYLTRTVKFEPREGREKQGLLPACETISDLTNFGIPIVIDTHRINYTGSYKDKALMDLQKLLQFVSKLNPVFLTTVELGDAIENKGIYQDVFSGEQQSLTPISSSIGKMSARLYEIIHG